MKKPSSSAGHSLPIDIIGMGMGRGDLTADHLRLIEAAALLVGGRRHLALFPEKAPQTLEITSDLKGLTEDIRRRERSQRIVVLASGDPLYYGIGAYLVKALGRENVRIHPNITAVAAAFARMGEPWQDVPVVSLHGRRQETRLQRAIQTADRIAVFTDPVCSPVWIGDFLCRQHVRDLIIGVFENLGSDDERVSWHTPESISDKKFQAPNMVVLKREAPLSDRHPILHLGMPESAYEHERGVITKAEVRAVSLAHLGLMPGQALWDLGAGSGAVAIEASLLMPGGRIWAVEKNPVRINQIITNRDRYEVTNLEVVQADLPEGLRNLPDPDRVFIGGGGSSLGETLDVVGRRLAMDGIIVVNTVLMDSLHEALEHLKAVGMDTDVVQIQASRSRPLAASDRLEALNPVWIIRGRRKSA